MKTPQKRSKKKTYFYDKHGLKPYTIYLTPATHAELKRIADMEFRGAKMQWLIRSILDAYIESRKK